MQKTKRKIKNNTPLYLQKTLMFFRILKLKNTNKFKIYKILIQCHCIIDKQKHLEFIAEHYEEINSWFNSKEFKEKYINTNHPYPPLLNPERLNAKVESCKDNKLSALSLRGTNKVRDEAIHNVAYFKDSIVGSKVDKIIDCHDFTNAESCNDKCQSIKTDCKAQNLQSQSKSAESIQPYPNLSYESIPPELAWDLNLPLPRGYDCIWALFGLSGCVAFGSFLGKLGTSMLYVGAPFDKVYKKAYLYLRERSLNLLVWVSFDDRKELHREKLFSLMDSEVPLLMNVRDSFGRLKHGVNHGSFKTGKTQYSIDDPMELLVDRVTYGGQDKPHLDILGNFSNGNVFCGSPEIWIYDKIVQMLPNAKYVKYLDMQEIVGERTFDTMMKLAKEFGFPLPQEKDREFFTSKINNQYRYLLPITICINKKIQVFVQQQIHSLQDKIDILPRLSLDYFGMKVGLFC